MSLFHELKDHVIQVSANESDSRRTVVLSFLDDTSRTGHFHGRMDLSAITGLKTVIQSRNFHEDNNKMEPETLGPLATNSIFVSETISCEIVDVQVSRAHS